jgi:hypothetical protein
MLRALRRAPPRRRRTAASDATRGDRVFPGPGLRADPQGRFLQARDRDGAIPAATRHAPVPVWT